MASYLSVHAFVFGGIGMITLGMMSRVSLGHTGRSVLDPPPALFWIFAILFAGGILRVLFPLFDPSHFMLWIVLSQGLWIISFSMFLYVYTPMLVKNSLDE